MKTNKTTIKPLEKKTILTEKEQEAINFYQAKGSYYLVLTYIVSLFLIPLILLAPKGVLYVVIAVLLAIWGFLAVMSIVRSAPIVFYAFMDLLKSGIFKNKDSKLSDQLWNRARKLLAVFLGYDLKMKAGAKATKMERPEDFWNTKVVSDIVGITDYAKQKLCDYNNKDNVEVEYRLACYQCFFEAAHELDAINKQYYYDCYPTPTAIEMFLRHIEGAYQYDKQNFGKGKLKLDTIIQTSEKNGTPGAIKELIKNEMCKFLIHK